MESLEMVLWGGGLMLAGTALIGLNRLYGELFYELMGPLARLVVGSEKNGRYWLVIVEAALLAAAGAILMLAGIVSEMK